MKVLKGILKCFRIINSINSGHLYECLKEREVLLFILSSNLMIALPSLCCVRNLNGEFDRKVLENCVFSMNC